MVMYAMYLGLVGRQIGQSSGSRQVHPCRTLRTTCVPAPGLAELQ